MLAMMGPDVLLKEAAITLRGLRRDRVFTIVSVALLALGIGLTSSTSPVSPLSAS